MATTDEELAKKREHVQRLRQQVADAEATRVERERGVANDVEAARLDAEAARLQLALDNAKRLAKVSEVRAGAASVIETVKEDKASADAQAKAAAAAADKTSKEG